MQSDAFCTAKIYLRYPIIIAHRATQKEFIPIVLEKLSRVQVSGLQLFVVRAFVLQVLDTVHLFQSAF